MIIYCFDPQTGDYTGKMEAPKCPVTGLDVFPAWTTAKAPPEVGENQVAKYVESVLGDPDGHWVVEDLPVVSDPIPTQEEIKAQQRVAINQKYSSLLKQLLDAKSQAEANGVSTATVIARYKLVQTEWKNKLQAVV